MTKSNQISIKRLSEDTTLPLKCGSGYLLFTKIDYVLKPGQKHLMPTGISMEIFNNYYGQLHVLNDHIGKLKVLGGVIDSDYRGEVHGIIYNDSNVDYNFKAGDPLCKVVFVHINNDMINEVSELKISGRGEKGFGSTGK